MHDFKKELREKSWLDLKSNEHLFFLKKFGKSKGKILDFGCGNGFFLSFMKSKGWDVMGIEISPPARKNASTIGVETRPNLRGIKPSTYDAVMLRFVLEHLSEPLAFLKKIRKFLVKNGILITIVPNDFNPLQDLTQKMGHNKWWIKYPDHINYFNFNSLSSLLEIAGFRILYKNTDFPMEFFLLMGDNYVKNELLGKKSHRKRMLFEKNVEWNIRKKLYKSLANQGIGRTCILYSKNR